MSSDKSFPCPSCGAGLEWTPGTGLKCPFCGFQGEPEAATATARDHLKELRLDQAALTAATGYGTATKALTCSSCGATSEHPPEVTTTSCPFCGSHHVESLTELTAVIRPSSVLPFGVDKDGAIGAFRGWLSGLWFRPSALKSAAQLEHIVGVYIPAWTFDAQASSQWTAEAGHHYHVEETVTEVVDGKQVTRQKQVRKTRWEPAHGDHHAHYDDQLVQASGGLDQAAIKQLQPYPLEQLQPYDTRFLAGFQAERYKVDLAAAWRVASDELESMEESACRKQVPGDTQRNLAVRSSFSDVTYKHVLLPLWIAAYRYQDKPYRYIVNGVTGKASGEAPISWAKVALFVFTIVVMIGLCLGVLSVVGAVGATR